MGSDVWLGCRRSCGSVSPVTILAHSENRRAVRQLLSERRYIYTILVPYITHTGGIGVVAFTTRGPLSTAAVSSLFSQQCAPRKV